MLASAPWAARHDPTSVLDAAGAVYILGGFYSGTFFNDVWASTDGGERPDSRGIRGLGCTKGVARGAEAVPRGGAG